MLRIYCWTRVWYLVFGAKLVGLVLLIVQFAYLLKNPTPESRYVKLAYLNKQWVLWLKDGSTLEYTHHRVLFEGGLFFILHLAKESSQKRVVIFFDQIRPDNYRVLRILEAIN